VRSLRSVRLITRYHGYDDIPYPFPNDAQESERLDLVHLLMKNIFRGNILAPINPEPSRILDIGTGSGCLHLKYIADGRRLAN